MKVNKKTVFLFALTLLVAGYFSISPAKASAQASTGDSEEVNKLLSEAKAEAHQLESDADHMSTFGRSDLSYESHAWKISEIRDHVNQTGKILADLENAQDTASPWQQQAIDEIRPLLQEIADNTTAAIDHINNNPGKVHLKASQYDAYLKENYEVARELAALITDYVDYGKHKANYEQLAEELTVPKQ
jgi:chromosome segregation ATPase